METVSIFISSPGDVAEERDRARQVVEQLRRRYADVFHLKPVLWEDLPLQADTSFQEGIDLVLSRDRGVDIAIFILWSRLGSPVGGQVRRADGSPYRSGTEREFDLMMRARERSGGVRPKILFYTRQDETSFQERLRGRATGEMAELVAQKKLVEEFLAEEFKDAESGTNVRAYHSFDRPTTFSQRLRTHLQEMLDDLAGDAAGEVTWDIETHGPPFLGLEAFQTRHAGVFFGREEEILEARRALGEQARNGCAFLLLSGASGSGKSSLARAGVVPAIVENEIDATVAAWRTLILTPSELAPDPLAALVRRLASDDVLPELGSEVSALDELSAALRKDPELTFRLRFKDAFARAAARQRGGVRLVLVLDQLEEMFGTAGIAAGERTAFFAVLEVLARSGFVWTLATVRSDFYAHVQEEPALARMLSGRGLMPVLPPGPDAQRRLIEEPARMAGLAFEERDGISLAARIMRDAAAHAELLPLVEFVLREVYERRTDRGMLTHAAYDALGGVEGALAKRAEQTYATLPADAQESLAPVLQSLVTLGDEGAESADAVSGGERLVRQRCPLGTFRKGTPARALVDAFVAGRLFTADVDPATGKSNVTIAHESLLRAWPRAVAWAESNRDFLHTRSRVAARLHEGSPLLEGDPLLESARHHLQRPGGGFTAEQRAFIEKSVRDATHARLRRERVRRAVLVGLTCLAAVAVTGAGLSVTQWRQAKARQKDAEEQRDRANTLLAELRNTAPTFHEQARALLDAGKFPEALEKIGYAIGLNGTNADYRRFRAHLLQSSLHLADAATEYQRVLDLRSSDWSATRNLELCRKLIAGNGGSDAVLSREVQGRLVDDLLAQGRKVEAAPISVALGKGQDVNEAAILARLRQYTSQHGWNPGNLRRLPNGTFSLSLSGLSLGDLADLKGLPISSLVLDGTNLSNLSALQGLPLDSLDLGNTLVVDLSPLRGMQLRRLRVAGGRVRDLGPLKELPQLQDLYFRNYTGEDLSPLRGLPLTDLNFGGCAHVMDLEPLTGSPLAHLFLDYAGNSSKAAWDLAPLKKCASLETILVPEHHVNIGSLRGLPRLRSLTFAPWDQPAVPADKFWARYAPCTDPSHPVYIAMQKAGLDPVPFGSEVETNGMLAVRLKDTSLSDLRPFKGIPVQVLDINNTKVKDLEPLRGMPLVRVDLKGSLVTNLTPLADCPQLESLHFSPNDFSVQSLRKLPKLNVICAGYGSAPMAAADFWPLLDRLYASPSDAKTLLDRVREQAARKNWADVWTDFTRLQALYGDSAFMQKDNAKEIAEIAQTLTSLAPPPTNFLPLDLSAAFNADVVHTADHIASRPKGGPTFATYARAPLPTGFPIPLWNDGMVRIPPGNAPGFHQVRTVDGLDAIVIGDPGGQQPNPVSVDISPCMRRKYHRMAVLHSAIFGDGELAVDLHYDGGGHERSTLHVHDFVNSGRSLPIPANSKVAVRSGYYPPVRGPQEREMFCEILDLDATKALSSLRFSFGSCPPMMPDNKSSTAGKFTAAIFAISVLPAEAAKKASGQ